MYFSSKKAVSEITSFVLLTLLVVVVSLTAYTFVNSQISKNVAELDRNSMNIELKKMNQLFSRVKTYDSGSESISFHFNKGLVTFSGSNVTYQSLVSFEQATTTCFDNLCYVGVSGYERISLVLDGGYSFTSNLSLVPGYYTLMFTHNLENGTYIVSLK